MPYVTNKKFSVHVHLSSTSLAKNLYRYLHKHCTILTYKYNYGPAFQAYLLYFLSKTINKIYNTI